MAPRFAPLPTDLASAHALILAERAARLEAEAMATEAQTTAVEAQARAANAQATAARALAINTSAEALIAHMKLEIEKLRRALHGPSSERKTRLLEQMELQLEELETAATEDDWRRRKRRPKHRRSSPSSASGPRASRSPTICRASAL